MDLSRMDLNLLVAFDVLVTERHVTRAAVRLSIGQSAMSATLKRLRLIFDDRILMPHGRGLVATPLAERLAGPVREVLDSISIIVEQREQFDPESTRHTFMIMASDYVSMVFLHPLLVQLADEVPNVTLEIVSESADCGSQLLRGQIDMLIVPRQGMPDGPSFSSQFLFSDDYLCAVDGENASVGSTMDLEQFSTQPYMAALHGEQTSTADDYLAAQGVAVNCQIRTNVILAPFMLRGTQYMTMILGHLARYAQEKVDLRFVAIPIQIPPVFELMVWSVRNNTDAAHQWLRTRLAQHAVELGFSS